MNDAVRSSRIMAIFGALWFVASSASAEVMDKELGQGVIWIWCLGASLIGFVAGRWKPWLGGVLLVVSLILPATVLFELGDRNIGPHIVREAGWSYVVGAWAATVVLLVSHVSGIVIGVRGKGGKGDRHKPAAQ